jgi:hypothetical protein
VLIVPAGFALLVLAAGLLLSPQIDSRNHQSFSDVFATMAQVIATLVIALAIEARALPIKETNLRRFVVGITLTYVGVGGAASVLGLNPSLPSCLYEPLYAVAMAGGAGGLLTVLGIASVTIEDQFRDQRREMKGR